MISISGCSRVHSNIYSAVRCIGGFVLCTSSYSFRVGSIRFSFPGFIVVSEQRGQEALSALLGRLCIGNLLFLGITLLRICRA
ncbi:hypothetical protein D3C76_677850 [compost metagenome]